MFVVTEENSSISILDLTGKVWITSENGMNKSLDVSNLPIGVYLAKIELAKGITIQMLIKQ